MGRREGKGPPSKDLSVCFPTRAHLALMWKPFSSPRRHLALPYYPNHLRKSMRGGSFGGAGHASPYLSSGSKQMSSENLSEPTSPKVTCAGQIRVRPTTRSCRNWQKVMEEIERLHNNREKKPTWMDALGFKKEVMHFFSCLRRIKFDIRCLGAFSHEDITSDEEEEHHNDKQINHGQNQDDQDCDPDDDVDQSSSPTVVSKWFMVLPDNHDCGVFENDENSLKVKETDDPLCQPPANALLLMRCRSTPAKSWMEEKEEEQQEKQSEDDDHDHQHADDDDDEQKGRKEENYKRKSLMELLKYENDFYKLSTDIARETWVVGGIHNDPFSRSTSWKR